MLLRKIIHGDLDWIVMKTLEKDRTRRYETASGLAEDIRRHLASEPVLRAVPRRVPPAQVPLPTPGPGPPRFDGGGVDCGRRGHPFHLESGPTPMESGSAPTGRSPALAARGSFGPGPRPIRQGRARSRPEHDPAPPPEPARRAPSTASPGCHSRGQPPSGRGHDHPQGSVRGTSGDRRSSPFPLGAHPLGK